MKRQNWAETEQHTLATLKQAASAEALAAIVKEAIANQQKVYVVGKEHHWGYVGESRPQTVGVRLTDSTITLPDQDTSDPTAQVEVAGAVTLEQLNLALAGTAWAMPNMGAIAEQTVSGLVSTNTHGSSPNHGGFATLVEWLEFVDPQGNIIQTTKGDKQWQQARLVLGTGGKAGIITRLRLSVCPAFNLEVNERLFRNRHALTQPFIDLQVQQALSQQGFVRWFIFPNTWKAGQTSTGYSQLTTWQRTLKTGKGRGKLRTWIEGFVTNHVLKRIDAFLDRDFVDRTPELLYKITKLMLLPLRSRSRYVGRSDLTLTAEPNMPIESQSGSHTAEYYFPIEVASEAIRQVLLFIDDVTRAGECFVWKPMRMRIMRGDNVSALSQVYDEHHEKGLYITLDVDIAEGQFQNELVTHYAGIRAVIDSVIRRYNKQQGSNYPLTGVHIAKDIPYAPTEYSLYQQRADVKTLITYLQQPAHQTFLHPKFAALLGVELNQP